MQLAYWFNKNNEYEVVNAADCVKASTQSYYCLGCRIPVQVYGDGIQSRHFRHKKGTFSKECEYYAGAEQKIINSAYEGKKSTLFLVPSFNHYRLAIGLPNISETALIEAENENLRISIKTGVNSEFDVQVSRKYFSSSCYHYIYLDYLREQYAVSYNIDRAPTEIVNKWTDTISGVQKEGVVFKESDFACEKVSTKDGVFVGESYLFLTSKSLDHKWITGADFRPVQEIKFTNSSISKFTLFELNINEISTNIELFFAAFGLKVHESPKRQIVLWPPAIEDDDYLLLNGPNEIYLLHDSCEVLSIPFDKNVEMMPLQNGMIFKADKARFDINEQSNCQLEVLQPHNRKVIKDLNRKCFVKKFKSNILMEFRIENEQFSEHSIIGLDRIEFLYGTDVIAVYEMHKNRIKSMSGKQHDLTLLRDLKRIKGKPTVISSKTLWSIYALGQYEASYKYLKSLVLMGKMTEELSKYIRKIVKGENNG